MAQGSSVRDDEVARFDALAAQWWDPAGPMAPLHAMNPLRTGWIAARFPGAGRRLRILDVGCGAGLATEALARLGHDVLGIDAAGAAIAAARAHAAKEGVAVEYRHGTAEDLVAEAGRFDAVVALEVVEHVAAPAPFLATLAGLLAPEGRLYLSTLNRTARSFVVAKLGAEYLLRLLPRGTHDWTRFPTPAELAAAGRQAGLVLRETAGMTFDPVRRDWRASRDLSINYIGRFSLQTHSEPD